MFPRGVARRSGSSPWRCRGFVVSTRKPEGGLVSASAAARVTMHPHCFAMFTIVMHAHVTCTCTCTCFHAHERPVIRRSREIGTEIERGGQYACTCTGVLVRLEAHHSNGADSMRMHAFHQFLYSFCTVSVISFELTPRERCQREAWCACHVCCFRPPGGRPSCASADSVVLLSVHSTEFVLGLPRLLP